MEHGKPIFLHMEVLRAHRDVGRGSLKKRRPSCRSRDLQRGGGGMGFFLDQSRSARLLVIQKSVESGRKQPPAPERRMK